MNITCRYYINLAIIHTHNFLYTVINRGSSNNNNKRQITTLIDINTHIPK